jgi:hypothetical protein
MPGQDNQRREYNITAPATDAARQWAGWGTALKPALEPITMARKPLVGTVAENVLEHGTGALNVDGCRVVRDTDDVSGWSQSGSKASENRAMSGGNYARDAKPDRGTGRLRHRRSVARRSQAQGRTRHRSGQVTGCLPGHRAVEQPGDLDPR